MCTSQKLEHENDNQSHARLVKEQVCLFIIHCIFILILFLIYNVYKFIINQIQIEAQFLFKTLILLFQCFVLQEC